MVSTAHQKMIGWYILFNYKPWRHHRQILLYCCLPCRPFNNVYCVQVCWLGVLK